MYVFPVITGLQKPGLRGIRTMTPLCQQCCELEINGLPWNLLQHRSYGRGNSVKRFLRVLVMKSEKKAEIYFQEKTHDHCQKRYPLTALWAPLFEDRVSMRHDAVWDVTLCFLLATDAKPAGYSKQRQRSLGQVQQTNGLVRHDLKTLQTWKRSKMGGGLFQGKLDFFYCVTSKNIC